MWFCKNAILQLGIAGTLLAACLMSPPTARATLIGDTVTCTTLGSPTCPVVPTAIVGPGSEFTMFAFGTFPMFTVNITGSSYILTAASSITVSFGGAVGAASLDWIGDPTGEIIGFDLTSDFAAITSSDITFGPHFVQVSLAGLTISPADLGKQVVVDFITAHDQIPEPGTLAVFGLGLAGLGFARLRRRTT